MAEQAKIPLPRVLNNLPRVPENYAPPEERERIAAFDEQLTEAVRSTNKEGDRKPLQKLAMNLTTLNFGDMMEFATGSGGEAQKVWDWAVAYITKDMKTNPTERT